GAWFSHALYGPPAAPASGPRPQRARARCMSSPAARGGCLPGGGTPWRGPAGSSLRLQALVRRWGRSTGAAVGRGVFCGTW
ncbi:unnamed protein product, partial [Ectocarpus sp. 8 AP-2014]